MHQPLWYVSVLEPVRVPWLICADSFSLFDFFQYI
jgi:hypothetical protein